jgi:hypothetical protein
MKAARTSGRDASGPAAQVLATEVAELFYNLPSVTTCAGQVPNGTRGNGGSQASCRDRPVACAPARSPASNKYL